MERLEAAGPNAEQITYWNEQGGPRWVGLQEALDAQLAPFGRIVMDRLAIGPGERVLDVGCGCGETTLELGRRVGPRGTVVGVDISTVMLERARQRGAGAANVEFLAADAQTRPFVDASFDVVFSRFGVMFFQDPHAAFANFHRALAPGGRLGFHCWKTFKENDFMTVPFAAALRHVPPPPPPPSPDAPGPFAFADPDRVRGILGDAGFAEVGFESRHDPMALGAGVEEAADFALQLGPASLALREASSDAIAKVRASVREVLAAHVVDGRVRLGTSSWVVTARKL
ncbi:MAG: methyltransferase domain-containing protein [Deltaproteobacteria bacterium]|nr:methyltransferase domain-containing protein [Deltaproteobacteria bacterium]